MSRSINTHPWHRRDSRVHAEECEKTTHYGRWSHHPFECSDSPEWPHTIRDLRWPVRHNAHDGPCDCTPELTTTRLSYELAWWSEKSAWEYAAEDAAKRSHRRESRKYADDCARLYNHYGADGIEALEDVKEPEAYPAYGWWW